MLGAPEGDLEENKDEVTLRCVADANPPAKIVWRKSGRQEPFSYEVKFVQIAILILLANLTIKIVIMHYVILIVLWNLQETVAFKPLLRRNAGSYTCEAKNYLGSSQAINVDIDVKCKFISTKYKISFYFPQIYDFCLLIDLLTKVASA